MKRKKKYCIIKIKINVEKRHFHLVPQMSLSERTKLNEGENVCHKYKYVVVVCS